MFIFFSLIFNFKIMENKICVSVFIYAPAAKVWEYYTEPKHIINWNFADPSWHCPKAENDLRVGGRYLARMEAKDGSFGFDFESFYTEVIDGKEFSYKFGGRKANVKFLENGNTTEVIVNFEPENENPVEMQRFGWQSILDNFRKYVEAN